MLELEAARPAPLPQPTPSRREGGMQRCARFSGTIPTANERWEIRGAGALRCFQVSPRLAGAAQVQMFANIARPPSQPGGGG